MQILIESLRRTETFGVAEPEVNIYRRIVADVGSEDMLGGGIQTDIMFLIFGESVKLKATGIDRMLQLLDQARCSSAVQLGIFSDVRRKVLRLTRDRTKTDRINH